MAKIERLAPFILKWEGGFVNDPVDRGGPTNRGVTIATWRQVGYDKNGDGDGAIDVTDLRLLTADELVERSILLFGVWTGFLFAALGCAKRFAIHAVKVAETGFWMYICTPKH